MKKEQALLKIASLFRRWPDKPEKPTGTDALVFFGWLQRERPHLLQFKDPGDRWRAVHGYLMQMRLVSD
jgi:hypothetical protein